MITIKNERGYALLLVLLTIVIIGIFIPVIFSSIISSSSQFQKTEEDIQRGKLEQMAEVHIQNMIQKEINNFSGSEEIIFAEVANAVHAVYFNPNPEYQFQEGNQKFKINLDEEDIDEVENKVIITITTMINSIESTTDEIEIKFVE